MEYSEYKKIHGDVRKALTKHKIHLQPVNTERLYLPKNELRRGIGNIIHKSKKIELRPFTMLNDVKNTSNRRAMILKMRKYQEHC